MATMADRIRLRRKELGLTQADLAAICGISTTAVMKWEREHTHNLKGEHLFMVADALNVHARWLALGDGPKVASSDREAYQFAIEKSRKAIDREQKAWHRIAAAFSRAVLLAMVLTIPQQGEAATLHNQPSGYTFWAKLLKRLRSQVDILVVKPLQTLLRGNGAGGHHSPCSSHP